MKKCISYNGTPNILETEKLDTPPFPLNISFLQFYLDAVCGQWWVAVSYEQVTIYTYTQIEIVPASVSFFLYHLYSA